MQAASAVPASARPLVDLQAPRTHAPAEQRPAAPARIYEGMKQGAASPIITLG